MRSGCIFVLAAFVILNLWGSTSDSRAGRMSRTVFRMKGFGGLDFRNASDAKFDPENDSGVLSSRRKRQAIRVDPKSLTDYHNILRRGEALERQSSRQRLDVGGELPVRTTAELHSLRPDAESGLRLGNGRLQGPEQGRRRWVARREKGTIRSVCAHYTTMVKWDQVNLGCAFTVCPSLYAFRTYIPEASYLNCEYFSPYGEFPKTPYEKGAACSKCPQKFPQCKEGLCTGSDSVYDEFDPRKIKASSSIHSLNVFTLGGCLLATDRLFLADMFQTL